ncbi:MAG TPA: hypothetical protein VFX50_06970, partial [Gemmatimonadales bacterium]|nr:hypothetical protein [Gemmatimonadales bacterium]
EPKSAAEVLSLLLRVHREGAALLVGTTRAEVANVIGGRRYVIEEGHLREFSPNAGPVPPPAPPRPAAPAAPPADSPPSPDLFTPPATGGA